MAKVITFTANLLAETTYEFDVWQEGRTQRAVAESFQVGGKGINVSKMLNRLEAENEALCFPGGDWGPACERWLAAQGIATVAFHEGCVVRSGVVVGAPGKEETTFLGCDSLVSDDAIQEAVAELKAVEGPFVLAVCGSVQGWADQRWEVLREWIASRGGEVALAVDSYGPALAWLAEQGPDLVKINREELELLFEESGRGVGTATLLDRARERFGCQQWVVTNGPEAVWVLAGQGRAERFEPPRVECISPTGCGDIVFATVIDCLYNKDGYGLLEAARLGSEYASRSAALPGVAEFEL